MFRCQDSRFSIRARAGPDGQIQIFHLFSISLKSFDFWNRDLLVDELRRPYLALNFKFATFARHKFFSELYPFLDAYFFFHKQNLEIFYPLKSKSLDTLTRGLHSTISVHISIID